MTDRPVAPGSEPIPGQPDSGWPDGAEAEVSPPFSLPDEFGTEPLPSDEQPPASSEPITAAPDEVLPGSEEEAQPEEVRQQVRAGAPRNQVRVTGTRRRADTAPRTPRYAAGTQIGTQYDTAEELEPERGYGCADVITAVFLLGSITVCALTLLLIANPHSPLNPLPPPSPLVILVLPSPAPTETPTPTFTPLPASPTPLDTATLTPTTTPTPTGTPTPTDTPVVGNAPRPSLTASSAITDTASKFTPSPFAFTVKPVRYTSHTGKEGCNWQSIAGSVVDLAGKPIKGLAVHITGSGGNVDEVHYSGNFTDTAGRFGEGGFEAFLGGIARDDQYTLQLLGPTGSPISDLVNDQTKSDCKQNVTVVNFVQNHGY